MLWWWCLNGSAPAARQVKWTNVSLSGGNIRLTSSCLSGKHHFNGEKLWECSLRQSDEEIWCSPIMMCLSYKHILTSVLGSSVFQQTCCALYNVKNRSCKDIILLNICNFADINANIHLFEMKLNKNVKVPAIRYNPTHRLTLLC